MKRTEKARTKIWLLKTYITIIAGVACIWEKWVTSGRVNTWRFLWRWHKLCWLELMQRGGFYRHKPPRCKGIPMWWHSCSRAITLCTDSSGKNREELFVSYHSYTLVPPGSSSYQQLIWLNLNSEQSQWHLESVFHGQLFAFYRRQSFKKHWNKNKVHHKVIN